MELFGSAIAASRDILPEGFVKDNGVLIPKRFLKGVKEVEIRKERNLIVITPTILVDDSVFELGKHPVRVGVADGSLRHDDYLYLSPCPRYSWTRAFLSRWNRAMINIIKRRSDTGAHI